MFRLMLESLLIGVVVVKLRLSAPTTALADLPEQYHRRNHIRRCCPKTLQNMILERIELRDPSGYPHRRANSAEPCSATGLSRIEFSCSAIES